LSHVRKAIATTAVVLLSFPLGAGRAAGAGECRAPEDVIDGGSYLRSLSLDLRGVVPAPEEYDLLRGDGTVPGELIDQWLDEPAFAEQATRFHKSLLWPNVSDVRVMSNRQRLILRDGIWWRYLVAIHYRNVNQHCGDFEAEFAPDGTLLTRDTGNGGIQEGWVWVNPYWDPENPVKVCAFEAQGWDAQEAEVYSPFGTRCDMYDSRFDKHCGCGPKLAWCDTVYSPPTGLWAPVTWGMADDLNRRVYRVINGIDADGDGIIEDDEELPYTELFYGRTMFVNGPLVHAYKYMIRAAAHVRMENIPVDVAKLPDLQFTDYDEWREVELGPEQAGILTSPLFLMKFSTNRARANRFYNAFLCQPFEPPPGGIDLSVNDDTLDLTKKDGCKYCHSLLEPEAAHWGRWTEYGVGYMSPQQFPSYNSDCAWCMHSGESCSPDCQRYYIIDPLSNEEDPYIGMLHSYEFRGGAELENLSLGPTHLVDKKIADGSLPRCVARNTAGWLLGRGVAPEEEAWVSKLGMSFEASGFSYDELVKAIVTSDQYRRVK
jgi:hypothetical protein